MRRIQQNMRRFAEQLFTTLYDFPGGEFSTAFATIRNRRPPGGVGGDCTPMGAAPARMAFFETAWAALVGANEPETARNESFDFKRLLSSISSLSLWPRELTYSDREEILVAMAMAKPSVQHMALKSGILPLRLQGSSFVISLAHIPFNLPDFPPLYGMHRAMRPPSTVQAVVVANELTRVMLDQCTNEEVPIGRLLGVRLARPINRVSQDLLFTSFVSIEELQVLLPTIHPVETIRCAIELIVAVCTRLLLAREWWAIVSEADNINGTICPPYISRVICNRINRYHGHRLSQLSRQIGTYDASDGSEYVKLGIELIDRLCKGTSVVEAVRALLKGPTARRMGKGSPPSSHTLENIHTNEMTWASDIGCSEAEWDTITHQTDDVECGAEFGSISAGQWGPVHWNSLQSFCYIYNSVKHESTSLRIMDNEIRRMMEF
eukprot:GHVO01034423.1.p1 GENE.GHVO01034423.1~~GHVO01034423.1.p1  ORF type:complete len:436 (+),score=71.55 GHVO01034423.1:270-1577(+)